MEKIKRNHVYQGDALEILRGLPEKSISMSMSSPPYWSLRDYGIPPSTWDETGYCIHDFGDIVKPARHHTPGDTPSEGSILANSKRGPTELRPGQPSAFCTKCGAWRGCLGLEPTPELFIKHLCDIYDEVKRVTRDDGTCWVNLGDTYGGSGGAGNQYERFAAGKGDFTKYNGNKAPAKSLVCIPFMFALEMINRGWILRNVIIWHKNNCMPSSASDRFTIDFEYLFFFSKQKKYYFEQQFEPLRSSIEDNLKAISCERKTGTWGSALKNLKVPLADGTIGKKYSHKQTDEELTRKLSLGRNKRAVWTINTKSYKEAHFACVSSDTECLTRDGWKRYNEIKPGDIIAGYNMERNGIYWTPCQLVKTYDIDQEIIHVNKRDLDILMTPNHRNVVLKKNGEETIVLAENLAHGDKIRVAAPFHDGGNEYLDTRIAELLGWVITEGHYSHKNVKIYQNEGKHADRIRKLLKGMIYTEKTRRGNQVSWTIKKSSAAYIRQLIPKKELTKQLVNLSIEKSKSLFNGLIAGDGHVREDDGRITFIQKNKTTVDWFTILAMRLGYHPQVGFLPNETGGTYRVYLTRRTHIGIRNSKGKNVERVHYKGIVWCPKTKHGTWVARRNGKIFITGNTYPPELCETPIAAGCPLEICTKCGKPRERILMEKRGEKVPSLRITEEQGNPRAGGETYSPVLERKEAGYSSCSCNAPFKPGIVLDPFMGSGTTATVAESLGRDWIGIEINPEYIELAMKRLETARVERANSKSPKVVRNYKKTQELIKEGKQETLF